MISWYIFKPVDTLFFRGSKPMEKGENHSSVPVFPPSVETVSGALRTAVLRQKNINFEDYADRNFNNEEIIAYIGKCSDKNPFNVIGPLFMKNDEIFVPAPYSWFMESRYKSKLQNDHHAKITIIKPFELETLMIKTSSKKILWAKPDENEVVSIGGNWIKFKDLISNTTKKEIFTLSYFVDFEPRTGIALSGDKKVKEHHIYSFTHVRFKEEVNLIFAVNKELPIKKKGILKLGAEQRFGEYEKIEESFINLEKLSGKYYMSLSIVPKSNEANNSVVATGKPIYLGGWDLAKGFHKPMIGYFPAGSIFSEKINKNFIPIN